MTILNTVRLALLLCLGVSLYGGSSNQAQAQAFNPRGLQLLWGEAANLEQINFKGPLFGAPNSGSGPVTNYHRIDLTKNSGTRYHPGDDSFHFETPYERTYAYDGIYGNLAATHLIFGGHNLIGGIFLQPYADNSITLLTGTSLKIYQRANVPSDHTHMIFQGLTDFNFHLGVQLSDLEVDNFEGTVNLRFDSTLDKDHLPHDDEIKLDVVQIDNGLLLGTSVEQASIKMSINNSSVHVGTKEHPSSMSLRADSVKLVLEDGTAKSSSKLTVGDKIDFFGQDITLKLGSKAAIDVGQDLKGAVYFHGSAHLFLSSGSKLEGSVHFEALGAYGDTSIRVVKSKDSSEPAEITSLNYGDKRGKDRPLHNTIVLDQGSALHLKRGFALQGRYSELILGINSQLSLGEKSAENISFASDKNRVVLNAGSTLDGSLKFNLAQQQNSIDAYTTSLTMDQSGQISKTTKDITVKGTIGADGAGSSYINMQLHGTGGLIVEGTGDGIKDVSYVDVSQGYIEVKMGGFSATNQGLDLHTDVLASDKDETRARISALSLSNLAYKKINMTFGGVSKYVGSVGDTYAITLFKQTVGSCDPSNFSQFKDNLHMDSVLYGYETEMENSRSSQGFDIKVTLTKRKTFYDVVNSDDSIKDLSFLAQFLDDLVQNKNLSDDYFKILDDLAMHNKAYLVSELRKAMPVKPYAMLLASDEIAGGFMALNQNAPPFKISKYDLSLWVNTVYKNAHLNNHFIGNDAGGATPAMNAQLWAAGVEYSANSNLKLGGQIGYSQAQFAHLPGQLELNYNNYVYYGGYGQLNYGKTLYLLADFGYLNSMYEQEHHSLGESVLNNGPATAEVRLNSLATSLKFGYKYKSGSNMLVPWMRVYYAQTKVPGYNEQGFFAYQVEEAKYNTYKAGLGGSLVKVFLVHTSDLLLYSLDVSSGYVYFQMPSYLREHLTAFFADVKEVPIKVPLTSSGEFSGTFGGSLEYIMTSGLTLKVAVDYRKGQFTSSTLISGGISLRL